MENTNVVITPTINEEEFNTLVERIGTISNGLRVASCDIACICEKIRMTNAYVYAGYNDFTPYAEEVLGYKKGTISQMHSVMQLYGSKDANGNYTIAEKYRNYGVDKLYRLSREKKALACKSIADTLTTIDEFIAANEITPQTTGTRLREIIDIANGKIKPSLDNQTESVENSESALQAPENSESATQTPETPETSEPDTNVQVIRDYITFVEQWIQYANDKKMSDKDFRKAFIAAATEFVQ